MHCRREPNRFPAPSDERRLETLCCLDASELTWRHGNATLVLHACERNAAALALQMHLRRRQSMHVVQRLVVAASAGIVWEAQQRVRRASGDEESKPRPHICANGKERGAWAEEAA